MKIYKKKPFLIETVIVILATLLVSVVQYVFVLKFS